MRSVLRLLRKPRWILATVLAGSVIVAFIALGLWQLRRLDERRDANFATQISLAAAPVPLEDLLSNDAPDEIEYRRVTVEGSYESQAMMLLAPRTRGGQAGAHVLMPLTADIGAVVVDRGWVPAEGSDELETPPGLVALVGKVRPGEASGRFNAETATVTRVDLELLETESGMALAPFYIELETQSPAQQGSLPAPADSPDLGEGNHQLYAIQWFLFAGIVAVGLPLLLYRNVDKVQVGDERR